MDGLYAPFFPKITLIGTILIWGKQTLLCPVMFNSIEEKTLYIFAISNVIAIPMVWALYPESNQRTLEDMDLLFASSSPWTWNAEKTFARLKAENPGHMVESRKASLAVDPENGKLALEGMKKEEGADVGAEHVD